MSCPTTFAVLEELKCFHYYHLDGAISEQNSEPLPEEASLARRKSRCRGRLWDRAEERENLACKSAAVIVAEAAAASDVKSDEVYSEMKARCGSQRASRTD